MIRRSVRCDRLVGGNVPAAGEQETRQDEGNQPEGEFTGTKKKETDSRARARSL